MKFVANIVGVVNSAKKISIDLIEAISNTQIEEWYQHGAGLPSTEYIAYACTPVKSETYLFVDPVPTSPTLNGVILQKLGHRVLFEVSGKVFNPADANNYIDFFYEKNADGSVVFSTGGTNPICTFFDTFVKPTALDVPFQPSGIYRFTVDCTQAGSFSVKRTSEWATAVGTITMVLTDLGEAP